MSDSAQPSQNFQELQKELDGLLKKVAGPEPSSDAGGAGLLQVMELEDNLRQVYLILLKAEPMSLEEIRQSPLFADMEDRDMLPVFVKTLLRQGHLVREEIDGRIKYIAEAGRRKSRVANNDIWDMLNG